MKNGVGSNLKVIVHLGFPKTASSTLQFGPLLKLEKAGLINLMTWRKNDSSESLKDRPSSCLFRNIQIHRKYKELKTDMLNVLSDESFTAPTRLRNCNFGKDIINPINFPAEIRCQLENASKKKITEFHWLMVLRKQSSLIASQYVEEYNWKRFNNTDLLFNDKGEIDLDGYEIYNFANYISSIERLSKNHGDKMTVLLYEDMHFESDNFYNSFDKVFGVKSGFFKKSFQENFHNSKNKSNFGTFTKDGKYFIPFFRDELLESIDDYFLRDNKRLSKYIDKDKLLRYGYIRA